jgi:hypothetical protein
LVKHILECFQCFLLGLPGITLSVGQDCRAFEQRVDINPREKIIQRITPCPSFRFLTQVAYTCQIGRKSGGFWSWLAVNLIEFPLDCIEKLGIQVFYERLDAYELSYEMPLRENKQSLLLGPANSLTVTSAFVALVRTAAFEFCSATLRKSIKARRVSPASPNSVKAVFIHTIASERTLGAF